MLQHLLIRIQSEVYKPASWKSPAKHVRFDMRIIKEREFLHNPKNVDWAGWTFIHEIKYIHILTYASNELHMSV